MCVGSLFGGNRSPLPQPVTPIARQAAPTVKAATKGPEYVEPEKIKEETGDDEKITTKKKKALEIQKTKEGVKEFSAIDPKSMPQGPDAGINTP